MRDQSERVAARVRELLSGNWSEPAGSERDASAPAHGELDLPVPGSAAGPRGRGGSHRSRAAAATRCRALLSRLPVRVDPGRRAVLGVLAAVLVAAVATGAWVVSQRPKALDVSAAAGGAASTVAATAVVAAGSAVGSPVSATVPGRPPSAAAAASSSPAVLVVDVAGRVHRPGLYRLAPGSRVDDAVRAAGGARPGVTLTALNLAAPLADGEQILVGVAAPATTPGLVGSASAGGGGGPAGAGTAATPVSLNSADAQRLQTLPGVGPVLAQHILDWRTQHGSFSTVDQLDDVPGIGEVKFAALRPLVSV